MALNGSHFLFSYLPFVADQVLGNKGGITIVNATGAHYQTTPSLKITGVSINFLSEDDKLILATGNWLTSNQLPSQNECQFLSDLIQIQHFHRVP